MFGKSTSIIYGEIIKSFLLFQTNEIKFHSLREEIFCMLSRSLFSHYVKFLVLNDHSSQEDKWEILLCWFWGTDEFKIISIERSKAHLHPINFNLHPKSPWIVNINLSEIAKKTSVWETPHLVVVEHLIHLYDEISYGDLFYIITFHFSFFHCFFYVFPSSGEEERREKKTKNLYLHKWICAHTRCGVDPSI
jgi:hypothetical protein